MASFCMTVLKRGEYAVIMVDHYMFGELFSEFSKNGYSAMPFPYLLNYKDSSVPNRPSENFNWKMAQYCMLATDPGFLRNNFKPVFNTELTDLQSTVSSKMQLFTS